MGIWDAPTNRKNTRLEVVAESAIPNHVGLIHKIFNNTFMSFMY